MPLSKQDALALAEEAGRGNLTALSRFLREVADGGLNRPVEVTDATTYAVLAENSGRDHFVPDFTASCTATLPAAKAGLRYRFIYTGGAADAQDFLIDTGPTANFWLGGVTWLDNDSATDNVAGVFSDATDDDVLTIVTPDAGTVVECYCDGTNWTVWGTVVSATTPTFG